MSTDDTTTAPAAQPHDSTEGIGSEAFQRALSFTMSDAVEGGYTEGKNDPGGETKFGISKRAYPKEDIKALTRRRAAEIYEADYWQKVHGDDLPLPLAFLTFDVAVNAGVHRAVTFLQVAVKTAQDGVLGPATIGAAAALWAAGNEADMNRAIERFHAARQAHFERLPTFKHFGRGWTRRNDDARNAAFRMVANGEK